MPRILALLMAFAVVAPCTGGEPAAYRAGMAAFAEELAKEIGRDGSEVEALLSHASYNQRVIDAITRPYEARPWYMYRPLFVTPERRDRGLAYWREHAPTLERAEAHFGVDPAIIVAIIGIETNYGRQTGGYRVIDALTTLAFAYPPRSAFFRGELAAFVSLARDEGLDALGVQGSYAGAIGIPQFIASSYSAYAVDFDGDGRRDLLGSHADAIGSVANYLVRHGWRRDEWVALAANVPECLPADLPIATGQPLEPRSTPEQLAAAGFALEKTPIAGPVTLIRLAGRNAPEYWIGSPNFYAITRYNHSNLYAMAVHQLSRAIAAGRARPAP